MLSQPSLRLARLRRGVNVALQVFILALLGVAFFIRTPQVNGLSMEPHIDSGEYVLIDTIAFRFLPPRHGDIVAFHHGTTSPETYLKRVIALPGERVAIDRGVVILDGKPLNEPYVRYRDGRSRREETVPAHTYFVLGDNRANSDDSRDWGFLDAAALVGRALFAVWPADRIGRL